MSDNGNIGGYLPPNISRLIVDFKEGGKIADKCRISDLENIFSWMRGFLNAFTGFAGFGKTGLVLFLMLVKSVIDDWKWAIWSPEMIDSVKNSDGRMVRSAHKIYNILIHAYTGKNPYKHKSNQMTLEEYQAAMLWIEQHFFVLDTHKDRSPKTVINGFKDLYETFGTDGFLLDPWKNLTIDEGKTTKDVVLERVFGEFEDLVLDTDMVGNLIAHPKSMDERRMRKNGKLNGEYKVVTQHDLLGGSAWDNSMDGIFSYHRHEKHLNPNSPKGSFYTLKQRSQELTTKLGYYDQIHFDELTNRFYFNGVCPLDGSLLKGHQSEVKYENHYDKMKKAKPNMEAPLPTDPPF